VQAWTWAKTPTLNIIRRTYEITLQGAHLTVVLNEPRNDTARKGAAN
jgi:hypothetical protein